VLFIACAQPEPDTLVTVTLRTQGEERQVQLERGLTVNDLLRQEGIELDELDDLNPPGTTPLTEGQVVTIVDVSEETIVTDEVVPFERRRTVNESLPAGQQQLLQPGVNGRAEVTYRITYRDGVEVSRNEIRRVIIEPAADEVIMVGSQAELPTITVNGTLVYVSGGNVWVVRQNSANRRPLTVNGGVDERVFELSDDGLQLLFTRSAVTPPETETTEEATPVPTATPDGSTTEAAFNTLWLHPNTADPEAEALPLTLENILYAQWVPEAPNTILYSTAEPRETFPGWQANNDLWVGQITAEGEVINQRQLLESSSGGVYGFFGTAFALSPDGLSVAWAQPDAVGVLRPIFAAEEEEEEATPTPTPQSEELFQAIPLLTPTAYERETKVTFAPRNAYDFVWRPVPVWSPDGRIVLVSTHGEPIGTEAPEDSPVFNLTAFPPDGDYAIDIVEQAGIFAFPQFSPVVGAQGQQLIAYMQAVEPLETITQYRLALVEQDGSNQRVLFPAEEDEPALQQAQTFAWSPDGRQIAVSYRGNIFLVDVSTGLSQQLTGDGLSTMARWAP
jgi:hypothetical protein